MAFPHRNVHFSNTSIFLTAMDVFIATFVLYMTVISAVGLTRGIWQVCGYVFHHWWWFFQLPVYWVAFVVWLLVIIFACVFVSLAFTVYYQVWGSIKELFANEEEEEAY